MANAGDPPDLAQLLQAMANQQQQLTAALTALTAATTALGAAGGAGGGNAPAVITDIHATGAPYDLNTRVGLTAYLEACKPLDFKYDGSDASYPPFINALQRRTKLCCWDAAGDTGITTVAAKDIFKQISQITEAQILNAHTNRTDDRAVQNSKALYKCLIESLSGNLHSNFFNQPSNLPTIECGLMLFKFIAKYTTVDSHKSAQDVMQKLNNVDPSKFDYNIIKINEYLDHLFVRASNGVFAAMATDEFMMLFTLMAYKNIKRPQEWDDFVHRCERDHTSRTLVNPRVLMNDAVNKYNELKQFTDEYKASKQTLEEHLVAMSANLQKQQKKNQVDAAKLAKAKEDSDKAAKKRKKEAGGSIKKEDPPFLKHTKDAAGKAYKADEEKKWNNESYYFHPSKSHKDGKHWFLHHEPSCECCTKFKKAQKEKKDDGSTEPTTAALSDLTEDVQEEQEPQDVEALLSSAYDQLEGNQTLQAHIAQVLAGLQE